MYDLLPMLISRLFVYETLTTQKNAKIWVLPPSSNSLY